MACSALGLNDCQRVRSVGPSSNGGNEPSIRRLFPFSLSLCRMGSKHVHRARDIDFAATQITTQTKLQRKPSGPGTFFNLAHRPCEKNQWKQRRRAKSDCCRALNRAKRGGGGGGGLSGPLCFRILSRKIPSALSPRLTKPHGIRTRETLCHPEAGGGCLK